MRKTVNVQSVIAVYLQFTMIIGGCNFSILSVPMNRLDVELAGCSVLVIEWTMKISRQMKIAKMTIICSTESSR